MHAHGLVHVRSERGFTLVEILVVLIVIAMLMAIAIPTLNRSTRATDAPQMALAGGALWRAIHQFRADNHGSMPPVATLTAASTAATPGTGFEDPGRHRYLESWPRDNADRPVQVLNGGTGAVPTAANYCASRAGRLVYGGTSGTSPHTAWLVGCSSQGQMVFRRSVMSTLTATTRPIG